MTTSALTLSGTIEDILVRRNPRGMKDLQPALVLGYLIMGLLWPWSVLMPLNPLYAIEYFDTFFEKPWKEL